jgi:hypothetical protein
MSANARPPEAFLAHAATTGFNGARRSVAIPPPERYLPLDHPLPRPAMARTLTCPDCDRPVSNPAATRCSNCGASIVDSPRPRRKKKKRRSSQPSTFPIKWVVIGGIALLGVTLLGSCLVLALTLGLGRKGTSSSGGALAVVDDLPDAPSDEFEPPGAPEPPAKARKPRVAWTAKPDPATNPVDYANVFGGPTPDQRVLQAALAGPFVIGVQTLANPATRIKNARTGDPSHPWKSVPQGDAPYPVTDVRTGKEVGTFPAAARLDMFSRLSSNGEYASSWQTEPDPASTLKHDRDFLVIWKRGKDKPVLRWPVPAHVQWIEFIGPDRLALFHTGPTPRFVVLDAARGAEAVTSPLPSDEFPPTKDLRSRGNNASYHREAQFPCGAVSPGGAYAAIGGKAAIIIFATSDGRPVGRLPLGTEVTARDFWGMSFDETGAELRAGFRSFIRAWSFSDGQPTHSGPYKAERPRIYSIVTGPEPGTLICGLTVVDLSSGNPILDLPCSPLRWLGPERLLAITNFTQPVNRKAVEESVDYGIGLGVFVTAFNRADYQKKAASFAGARANAPVGRPPTARADRSGVAIIRPDPKAPWAVKPSGTQVLPATASLSVWPDAFSATEAAVISNGRIWVRYDLKSGNAIGEPIRLWPNSLAEVSREKWRKVALAYDGSRLAVTGESDPTRVDVWDTTGKRITGLRPYADETIGWVGWSANGLLMTACSDLITGWDVASGRAVYEIDGAYQHLRWAPGGAWLLAMTPGLNIDFFDTATGKPLGRIPGIQQNATLSLAPDGKSLVRPLSPHGTIDLSLIQVWNLESGKRSTTPEQPVGPVMGHFVGPRHALSLVTPGGNLPPRCLLYDFDLHTHTFWYELLPGLDLRSDSLGRGWMIKAKGGAWSPIRVPGTDGVAQDLAFGPGATVRVEIDLPHRSYAERIAKQTAEGLQKRGLKIGKNGWLLRADHTIGKSSQKFDDERTGKKYDSPFIRLDINWKLLAPDGTEVWKTTVGDQFDPFRSKYVVPGSRNKGMVGPQGGFQHVDLDFQGKPAILAQIEEILENSALYSRGLPVNVPAYIAKTADGYAALPLQGTWDEKVK